MSINVFGRPKLRQEIEQNEHDKQNPNTPIDHSERKPNKVVMTSEEVQKMLNENAYLIQMISDNQNRGQMVDVNKYQQVLHRNLCYLATLIDEEEKNENLNFKSMQAEVGESFPNQQWNNLPNQTQQIPQVSNDISETITKDKINETTVKKSKPDINTKLKQKDDEKSDHSETEKVVKLKENETTNEYNFNSQEYQNQQIYSREQNVNNINFSTNPYQQRANNYDQFNQVRLNSTTQPTIKLTQPKIQKLSPNETPIESTQNLTVTPSPPIRSPMTPNTPNSQPNTSQSTISVGGNSTSPNANNKSTSNLNSVQNFQAARNSSNNTPTPNNLPKQPSRPASQASHLSQNSQSSGGQNTGLQQIPLQTQPRQPFLNQISPNSTSQLTMAQQQQFYQNQMLHNQGLLQQQGLQNQQARQPYPQGHPYANYQYRFGQPMAGYPQQFYNRFQQPNQQFQRQPGPNGQ